MSIEIVEEDEIEENSEEIEDVPQPSGGVEEQPEEEGADEIDGDGDEEGAVKEVPDDEESEGVLPLVGLLLLAAVFVGALIRGGGAGGAGSNPAGPVGGAYP